jgi:hypothetical protein
MLDAGAIVALTFYDAGLATTHPGASVPVAKGILNRLMASRPDVIVAELGDGILGDYGVQDILADRELMGLAVAHVMCAADPVGSWGAVEIFRTAWELPVSVVSGPATDNDVGRDYIRGALGVPAHNALHDAAGLVGVVENGLEAWPADEVEAAARGGS